MMTIREYLERVLDAEGYEAYEEIEETLISAYETGEEEFEELCASLGIELGDYSEVTQWVWDWCGE